MSSGVTYDNQKGGPWSWKCSGTDCETCPTDDTCFHPTEKLSKKLKQEAIEGDYPTEDYPYPDDAPYCDPEYEDCSHSPDDPLWYYNYDKSAVHFMTWMALFQVTYPLVIFTGLEERAYLESNAESRKGTEYWDDEIWTWSRIMKGNMYCWGPMFILGILSLSEIAMPLTSFFIEHGLSNMMIPAYLYGLYQIFDLALVKRSWEYWVMTLLFFAVGRGTYSGQIYRGQ